MLKVYNTISGRTEEFVPWFGKKVGMYVCGPTVYDFSHLGHARTYIAFDAIIRYLRYKGYEVKYVMNITDIDDKIIKRANERGEAPLKLAKRFERDFLEDIEALDIQKADVYPRVSEHMKEIVEMINSLMEKGDCYEVNGNVFFDVTKINEFGKLSHQTIEDIEVGARLEVDKRKRNPADFALWKQSTEGEPSWDSPWGKGRPGWHIECSAMSMKYLGDRFEIHGGGKDLIFPHHENEIAQSEAYSGKKPFVKYWLHTGFLIIEREKMSKSLGNIISIREFLKNHDPKILRFLVLSTNYRRPLNYSENSINQAREALERIDEIIEKLKTAIDKTEITVPEKESDCEEELRVVKQRFLRAMDSDFNTARALSQLFQLVRFGNKLLVEKRNKQCLQSSLNLMMELGSILGLYQERRDREELPKEVQDMIEERVRARKNKDWKKADEIRENLKKRGIELRDYTAGTRWKEKGMRRNDANIDRK